MTTHASIETATKGQIVRVFDRFEAKCLKNANSLPKVTTQDVLEEEGDELAQEMFEDLRRRVERRSEMIVRRVRVNRALTPEQVIEETGRVKYIYDVNALAKIPDGEGEEVDMYFFPTKRSLSVKEYETELAKRGLVADPRAQAAVNRDDPSFADEHPNAVQWDGNGCASFDLWGGGREVLVDRRDVDWRARWWLGGVRKSTLNSTTLSST